jgi:hypothetical protein
LGINNEAPQSIAMNNYNYIFTILALSGLSGWALKTLRTREGQSIAPEAQRVVARLSWVFLGIFSVEAMSKGGMDWKYSLPMFVYILIVYVLARQLDKNKSGSFRIIPVATTTFGGGNRGVAMISALTALPVLAGQKETLLPVFIQMDAVVILWLICVVPYLISDNAKDSNNPKIVDSIKSFANEAGVGPIVMVAAVVLGPMLSKDVKAWLAATLLESSRERSAILMYLSFTLMFATTALLSRKVGDLFHDLWKFYVSRLTPVTLVFAFLLATTPSEQSSIKTILNYSFALALLVLALCPPSSLLPALLSNSKLTDSDQKDYMTQTADLNIVTTFLFLGLAVFVASRDWLISVLAYLLRSST